VKVPIGRALLAPLALGALIASGCAGWQPVLRVRRVAAVPAPSGHLALAVWRNAPPLNVTLARGGGSLREKCPAQLRALSDGRTLAIMVVWPDDTNSGERLSWLWNAEAERYTPLRVEADSCALQWPLGDASIPSGTYDLWLWRAGWSDLSGFADDMTLAIETYPANAAPPTQDGTLFLSADRRTKILQRLIPDAGRPGTVETPPPDRHVGERARGAMTQDARGSVADVRVRSLFDRKQIQAPSAWFVRGSERTPASWLGSENPQEEQGFWLVEFHRLLTTADREADYQIRGDGPHLFELTVGDGDAWGMHFLSPPIELIMFEE
jgi:hypothetical protein